MELKRCCRCRNEYPATAEYFTRSKKTPDGLWCYCKACDKERVQKWRRENPDKQRAQKRAWAKSNPAAVKKARQTTLEKNRARWKVERAERYASDAEFREKQKAGVRAAFEKNGHRYAQRQRQQYRRIEALRVAARERAEAWRKENPDSIKVYAEKRRARLAGAPGQHTTADIERIYIEQKGQCIYCRCDISNRKYTIEHVVPISKGGSNWPENIALACRTCNARKGAKLAHEYLSYLGEING